MSDFRSIKIWKLKTEILSLKLGILKWIKKYRERWFLQKYSSDPIGILGYLVGVQISFCVLSKVKNRTEQQDKGRVSGFECQTKKK